MEHNERTLAIIKPDAFAAGHAGAILSRIFQEGFQVIGIKKFELNEKEVEGFYSVHKGKPFFTDLVTFMTSGPCLVMVLEGIHAIERWRTLMGKTDPLQAEEGTLRSQYGSSLTQNATHGSDAQQTAATEIGFFFSGLELL